MITSDDYQNESYCVIEDLNPESRITPLLKNLISASYVSEVYFSIWLDCLAIFIE